MPAMLMARTSAVPAAETPRLAAGRWLRARRLARPRWLRARRLARPLRVYGSLELAIGLSGLLLSPGFGLLERLDATVWALAPWAALLVSGLGIALLLGVPSLAMGATVPVFARVAQAHGTSLSALYGMNTLGASLGVVLVAFAAIPALGVTRTLFSVAALNLLVFTLSRAITFERDARATAAEEEPAGATAPRLSLALACGVVFSTGFVTFGLEVAWFRSLRAALQSVTESFAVVLASVLLPLALGARLTPLLRRRGVSPALLAGAAGTAVLLATPWVERMDILALVSGGYGLMLLKWLSLCLLILGPPMLLLGTLLPWCLEEFRDSGPCARLYAVNTLGAVLGSLSAVWLLLPSLGLSHSAWLLGAVMLLLAMRLAAGPRGRVIAALAAAAGLAIAVTGSSRLGYERVHGYASLVGHRLLAYREGPEATVSVVEGPGGVRNLLIDGFTATADGAPGSEYMEWMGRLPMLLHPAPRDALVICFGTGRTANAVLEEQPERLDVVDVNPDVFDLAKHFPSNRGVLEHPRVQRVAMDGRAWLRRSDRRYDVVTLEPMPPHFAGVNALYSLEFYRIAARRLRPGGVAAQWLPLHLLPPFHAASVAATFRSVFPNAALWMGPGTSSGILLGSLAPLSEPIGQRWPGFDRAVERAFSQRGVERFLILGPAALERYAALGELITDDNQRLAYDLVRGQLAAFGGRRMALANLRLIRQIARGLDARLPQPDEAAAAAPRRGPRPTR